MVARIEVGVPHIARFIRVERTRPVEAFAACVVETALVTVAGNRQEETAAVGGEEPAVYTVLGSPCLGRVLVKLLPFLLGWHAPVIAPVGSGCVVLGLQGGQVVGEAVVAIIGFVAIFGPQPRRDLPAALPEPGRRFRRLPEALR